MPIGTVARGMPLQPQQRVTDLVQARLDGSQLLISYDDVDSAGFSAAAFINQPLQDADPLVLANSWGQSSVSSSSIYSTSLPQHERHHDEQHQRPAHACGAEAHQPEETAA
jgi:hypothetical protein